MDMKPMKRQAIRTTSLHRLVSCVLLATVAVCGSGSTSTARAADNVASGGTITYTDANGLNPAGTPYAGGYVVHAFTAVGSNTFTVPAAAGSLDLEYLVVGGGGSGGSGYGGGGGAGGVLTNAVGTALSVPAGSCTVVVGAGGAGVSAAGPGTRGGASAVAWLAANGGGAGGGNGSDGGGGGSGGGGARVNGALPWSGGIGTVGQGNNGGDGIAAAGGGGGGGAGAAGGALAGNTAGGAGGVGVQNAISGVANWYAAGGSGVFNATSASGIGGKCQSGEAAGAGAPNTGSGGGGYTGSGAGSGAGGSGIVIVRYRYVGEVPLVARVTAPANGKGFYAGVPVTATGLVANGTAPYTVKFYTSGNGGAFAQAGAPITSEPYTADLGRLSAGTYRIYAVVTDGSAATATSPTNTFTVATNNVASGGTITYTDPNGFHPRSSPPYVGGYVVHTFTNTGANAFTVPGVADGLGAEYLIVAGGGSGGSGYAGGGGAGGLRTNVGGTLLPLTAGAHTLTVGSGGAGVSGTVPGNPGTESAAFGLKANGGGGGGGNNGSTPGGAGGSGGGSSGLALAGPGNTGCGNRGGAVQTYSGSGGGGAGSVGGAAQGSGNGGGGGSGLENSISGVTQFYAAGGSGVFNAASASGIGGKCQGGEAAGAGAPNTGSGGGGNTGTGAGSGAGGSGIVIVRYAYSGQEAQAAGPAFTPAPGGYLGERSVTLRCATPDAAVHYTMDGGEPTAGSPLYTNAIPIPLGTTVTIKALAVKDGLADSDIVSGTYTTATSATWASANGGVWPSAGNWLNGVVGEGPGLTVKFDAVTLAGNATVTLDGPRAVGGLTFADTGNAYNWTIATGGGGPLTLKATGTPTINVSNRTTTISAVVAGTNGLVKTGAGTLALQGVNTFSGGVTIGGGTLDWQNTPNSSAGTMTVSSGGTLKFYGTYLNYGYTVANALAGDGVIMARGAVGTGSIYNGSGYMKFTGDISGFTGTFMFDTTSNFGQLTTPANSDGSRAKWVVTRSGGVCYLSVGEVGTYKLGELSGNGALGAYYLSETTTWEVGALGTDSTFDGVIVNAISPNLGLAALKKVGAGKLTVTAASTYGGGTTVAGGILEVGAAGSLGTGTVEVVEGTLSLLGSAAIADAAQLRVAGGADKLHLAAGVDETVGEFFIDGVAKPWGKWGRIGNALAPRQTAAIAGDGILTVLIGAEPPGTVLIIR